MTHPSDSSSARRHRWPWVVLAVFVLGVVLAILWVSAEVRRTKQRREFSYPSASTNGPGASPGAH